jgi:hypothetical protein
MKKKNLYTESGEPKRITCYMIKREPIPADYITVIYTYANKIGLPVGHIMYRAMSEAPYHPLGICIWGEGERGRFNPGGSRIKFSDLPEDCQEVVRNDYRDIWESQLPLT